MNPETAIDGYKVDHKRQYPDKTQLIFSNMTPRKTRRPNVENVVFFGLQYFLKEYLIDQWNKNFFSQPKEKVIARFTRRINNYLGPNNVGTKHIEDLHDLGYLPIMIMALPEGSWLPLRVPPFVIFNTWKDVDGGFWITNYLETLKSNIVWGACTSATTAFEYKKLFIKYANETVGNTDFVGWQGHDFSFRGMFGMEAACISGAAHLISFTGTDTIPAIDFLEKYYNANCEKELIGGSVAATEHSVMCAGGDVNELETFRRLIEDIYPAGIVSIVSDTWDYWNVLTNTAVQLKEIIMKRDGKVVFRPDTGDPVKIVCGEQFKAIDDNCPENAIGEWARDLIVDDIRNNTPHGQCGEWKVTEIVKHKNNYFEVTVNIDWNRYDKQFYYIDCSKLVSCNQVELTPEQKGSIEVLWDIFGGTITDRGFKQLDSHVGLIYGDSITIERAKAICEGLKAKGFASTNLVYGIGSYTYQYVTRDTDGYAVKATFAVVDGQDREIYKNPKTDDGTKKSAKGLTAVFKDENNKYYLKDQATWDEVMNCELKPVFKDGKLLKDWTLAEVRANL